MKDRTENTTTSFFNSTVEHLIQTKNSEERDDGQESLLQIRDIHH